MECSDMENKIIEKSIEIKAPLNKVWLVFTDPGVTQQMGGYYDTEWKIGSSFGFKKADGNKLTTGTLPDFQPKQLIKHSLFEPNSETVMAVITYEFQQKRRLYFTVRKRGINPTIEQGSF